MIRKLMASCAVAALMSAGVTFAQAQTEPATPAVTQETAAAPDNATSAAPTTELAASEEVLTPAQPTLATSFMGKSVYSSADPESDNIGDVNDLIVSENGEITHAIVGVGGFLGIGEKSVAVPFDELKVVEKDGEIRLVYSATREQLEAAPAFDRTAYDPAARAAAETDTASTDPTGVTAPATPAAEQPADTMATAPAEPAPATDTTAAPSEQAAVEAPAPVEEPAPAGDTTAAPSDQAAVEAPAPAEDPAASPTTGDMAAAPAAEAPAGDVVAEAPAEPAPPGEPAAPADQMAAEAPAPDQAAPADQAAAEATPPMDADIAFTSTSADQVRASTLMGKTVLGPDDQSIGEISDLVLQKDGGTRVALIDVGGFLGVGEKTVAIPFEEFTFSKTDENAEPQVKVALSKEQLGQLPAFDTGALDSTAAVDTMPAPDATTAPAPDTAATTEQPAAGTDVAATPATPPTDEITTGSVSATQDVAASKLIGASVFGTDDSSIGEVSDIIFAPKGEIEAVIVDVGGFLGIGEKPVALNFDQLNIQTDEGGTMKVSVNATKEQLDQAPTYEVTIQ